MLSRLALTVPLAADKGRKALAYCRGRHGYYIIVDREPNAVAWADMQEGADARRQGQLVLTEEMTYDPDGRVAMYQNNEVGLAFYTYDGDGNVATYKEPTGGSGAPFGGITGAISDPTTYTYTYYGDDTLQQLAASSSALTSYSQQYGYRADDLLEAQRSTANWTAAGNTNSADYAWNETFTNAGRVTYKSDTLTDPYPGGQTSMRHTMAYNGTSGLPYALQAAYDAYGRISSWAIPSGSYTGWSYDAEGEPTGFTAGNQNFTLGYSTRGELLKEVNTTSAAGEPNLTWRSAGGFLYRTIAACAAHGCATFAFDPRNDALLAYRHLAINPNDGYVFCCTTTPYQYDAAGRRNGGEYDALNRLLTGGLNYAYGPGTIPVNRNTYTNHASLGVQPLYTTDASNVVQDLKLGMNSDIVPTDANWSGLTVYDRDPFGFSAAQRNATGTSAWTFPNLFSGCSDAGNLAQASVGYKGTSMSACGPNGALYAYRTDGYYDGALTFRGVRTYDSDTEQWSTPDAYQGSADDPMSGLGYNYAGNNPAMFADPSGFCQQFAVITDDGLGDTSVSGTFNDGASDCYSNGLFDDGFGAAGGNEILPGVGTGRPGLGLLGRATICGPSPGAPALPLGATWTAEYEAGHEHYLDITAIGPNIGQGGAFDYQRWGPKGPGSGWNASYTPASNYGVGVYMNGAGFGLAETEMMGVLYTVAKGQPGTLKANTQMWASGWAYASLSCSSAKGP